MSQPENIPDPDVTGRYPLPYSSTATNHHQNGDYAPPRLAERLAFTRRVRLYIICVTPIIILVFMLIYWLVFLPNLPKCTLQSFSQSGFNISADQRLSAAWDASLHVANPSKIWMIDYNQVIAHVIHKDSCLAEAQVPLFHQGKRGEQTVDVDLAVVNSYVDPAVLDSINGEKAGGEMKLHLKLYADFNTYLGKINRGVKKNSLKIWCSNISIRVNSSSGMMIGGPMKCRVKQYDGPIDGADCPS